MVCMCPRYTVGDHISTGELTWSACVLDTQWESILVLGS